MTVTDQSEGLAAGCLTIGKNDRVVAIHSRAYVVTCDGVVYRLVLRARQNSIKMENRRGGGRIAVVLGQELNRVRIRLCFPCGGRLRRAHADRDEDFVVFIGLLSSAEEIVVDFTGYVSGFDGFPVYEHFFWVDSADVHLAAVILVWVVIRLSGRARRPGS